MELGIYTFGEVTPDARTGEQISVQQRLRDLIEEIELADRVGLDVLRQPLRREGRPADGASQG